MEQCRGQLLLYCCQENYTDRSAKIPKVQRKSRDCLTLTAKCPDLSRSDSRHACVPKCLGKRPICSCKNCWQTRQARGSKVIAACLFWLMCLQETQKHRLTESWPCAVGDPSSRNLSCSHKHQFHRGKKKNQASKTRGPWTSLKQCVWGGNMFKSLGRISPYIFLKKISTILWLCFFYHSKLINVNSDSPLCGFPRFFSLLCPFNP